MKITSYVEMTPSQERLLEDFDKVEVRTSLIEPMVVATIKTFHTQQIKVTMDANGVIEKVWLEE